MNTTYAYVHTDLVSLGRNPEMADIDNPNGDIMGYAARVWVEKANGARISHDYSVTDRDEGKAAAGVQELCDRINVCLSSGGSLNMAHWHEEQPAYGSKAYQAGGYEEIQRQLEREEG